MGYGGLGLTYYFMTHDQPEELGERDPLNKFSNKMVQSIEYFVSGGCLGILAIWWRLSFVKWRHELVKEQSYK